MYLETFILNVYFNLYLDFITLESQNGFGNKMVSMLAFLVVPLVLVGKYFRVLFLIESALLNTRVTPK